MLRRRSQVKPETINTIIERAKLKRDGVYSFREALYSVKDSRVHRLSDKRKIYQLSYGFLCTVDDLGEFSPAKARDALRLDLKAAKK